MHNQRTPGPLDKERGRDIRRLRKSLGVSQADVAARIGVATQQYGKYERGDNRMSVARYETILSFLNGLSGQISGLSETSKAAIEAPVSKLTLQKSLDEMQATLNLWQRFLDQM